MQVPNTDYIDILAGDDIDFKSRFIEILKEEFPKEKRCYQRHLKRGETKKMAEMVHKIKHKFSILGMEGAYALAVLFEEDLIKGSTTLSQNFGTQLKITDAYIKSI